MYTNFFSLSEQPFSIAPDPKYLFMSDRHREALSHLTYGLGCSSSGSSNGGFVLLTGEVGTGKTTVSRCLMADLPDDTQLAFILNPTLSSHELLATICDQLKIRYRKTGATLKTLTDKISEKLLKNHSNNINTLLIIDEAQHLAPDVLEQLRLLTNLETNTKKLLQVILIGQPELQQLLKRRDLRQLAQRITARYHLLPLDKHELALYIKHRLSVADCHRALFNKSALVAIHQLSQGIPRLVNLICHSALMEAYNSNNAVVDKKLVYKAAYNALGDDFLPNPWWQRKSTKVALMTSLLFVVLVAGFWLGQKEPLFAVNSGSPEKIASEEIKAEVTLPPEQAVTINKEQEEKKTSLSSTDGVTTVVKEAEIQEIVVKETEVKKTPELITVSAEPKVTVKTQGKIENITEDIYKVEAVEGVSDDLLARFQAAIEETHKQPSSSDKNEESSSVESEIKPLTQMPAWVQNGVPNLQVEQHIYASNGQGWVNVNGRDRYQGDMITPELQLSEILPQKIILIYQGEKFSLPALTNW
jgi:general secretion pathway protein A